MLVARACSQYTGTTDVATGQRHVRFRSHLATVADREAGYAVHELERIGPIRTVRTVRTVRIGRDLVTRDLCLAQADTFYASAWCGGGGESHEIASSVQDHAL